MIIELDTEKLIAIGLTADEFVFLNMLNHDIDSSELKLNIDREKLQTNGWVKLGEEDVCTIREKFNDEFSSTEDVIWHGLLSRFPIKVNAKDGVRILRAKDPSSKANAKAKARYLKYIGKDKSKHEHVLKCLERELLLRRNSNSLGYMQMLDTWINNHTWDKYSDLSDGESNKPQPPSPEGRITRQL